MTVAQGIQHAMSMPHIILSSVACLPIPDYSTLSHTQHIPPPRAPPFAPKKLLYTNVCSDFLYTFYPKNFSF